MHTPNTEIPKKVMLADYNRFKKDFNELVAAMVNAKLHPWDLSFATRMRLLTRMEAAYLNIYKFGDDLMAEMPKLTHDKTNERYFLRALELDNIIKIREGENRDVFITAPPLGDRYVGNAGYLGYLTRLAFETARKNGAKFNAMQEVCVIVKQFCHCKDVAMGTVENREIHCLTDTILKALYVDDNPWYADFCYIWCESSNPRTEIIITDRKTASLYNDYVSQIYEPEPTASQRYNAATVKKSRMVRNIKRIGDILGEVNEFCPKYAMLDKTTSRQLCHLTKALMEIIIDLREPFISSINHEHSHLYTNDTEDKKKSVPEPPKGHDYIDEIYQRVNKYVKVDNTTKTIVIKTETPHTTSSGHGRPLCEDQETLLVFAMPKTRDANPLSHFSTDDLSVTVTRKLAHFNPTDPDSDNLNLYFLRPLHQRAKIIYIKTEKRDSEKKENCEVEIRPKSSEFWL